MMVWSVLLPNEGVGCMQVASHLVVMGHAIIVSVMSITGMRHHAAVNFVFWVSMVPRLMMVVVLLMIGVELVFIFRVVRVHWCNRI